MPKMTTVTANMSSLIRAETRDGSDYLVAPVVLITEGVHNHILYPAEELAKFPEAWNGRPLPLLHPTTGSGKAISANSPAVISKQCVGQVFGVQFEAATDRTPARLSGEAWIDVKKLEALAASGDGQAQKLKELLDSDELIEVSTGLFTEDVMRNGTWKDEEYVAVAVNHRPDHLALLPGARGACSGEDGCGMPRVNKAEKTGEQNVLGKIMSLLSRLANNQPTDNALTHRDMSNALDKALKQKLGLSRSQYLNVVDVKTEEDGVAYVVYEVYDERTGDETLYRRTFTKDDADQISLSDDAMTVIRRTEFIPQEPQTPQQPNTLASQPQPMQKGTDLMEEKVNAIIAHEGNEFTEADKPVLMKMNAAALDAILPEKAPATPKANADKDCGCPDKAATPNVNAEDKPVTRTELADLVSGAIKGVLPELVTNAVKEAREADERTPVLARLKADKSCKINADVLDTMTADALKQLEASLHPGRYDGQGGPRENADDEFVAPPMPKLVPDKTA